VINQKNQTLCSVLFGLASALLLASGASAQVPLPIENFGFETGKVSGSPTGHQSVPAPWESSDEIIYEGLYTTSCDTFDNNGAPRGLPPDYGYPDIFPGVVAYEGTRWVGGFANHSGVGSEYFWQDLVVPLVAGETYELSAALHRSDSSYPVSAGFEVLLGMLDDGDPLTDDEDPLEADVWLAGQFDVVPTDVDQWVERSFTFEAPTDAADRQRVFFQPFSTGTAYVAIDAIPEPGSMTLLVCGALGLLAYAWRRQRIA